MPLPLDDILPCFFDMPLADAMRILKVSNNSIIKCRKRMGLPKWPFDDVKKGVFKLDWKDICNIRKEHLSTASDNIKEVLLAADKRGWLMAKIYDNGPRTPEVLKDLDCLDNFFEGEEEILMDSSTAETAPALPEQTPPTYEEPQPAEEETYVEEPLLFDLDQDCGSGVYPFPENDDDEEEWGLLGFCAVRGD